MSQPLLLTIPHSGEQIPPETPWLKGLPETTVMRDVDRYVDRLYAPALTKLNELVNIIAPWHRYAGDLNRFSEDVDQSSVEGHKNPVGTHPRGFHWSVTTRGEVLMEKPMPIQVHNQLVDRIYKPFHEQVAHLADKLKAMHDVVYHLDAHSMPSLGTDMHPDPGERRAEIVISDQKGVSSSKEFVQLVVGAYKQAGFQVVMNWPYVGGRITQHYGRPKDGHHTVQVELNRRLYMDEETKKLIPEHRKIQEKLQEALTLVYEGVGRLR